MDFESHAVNGSKLQNESTPKKSFAILLRGTKREEKHCLLFYKFSAT